MPGDTTFRRLSDDDDHDGDGGGPGVTIDFDGRPVRARDGDSVAAALLAAGHRVLRTTPVGGAARGAYCMMGVCFDCLVEIDGRPNVQACMTPVRDGMRVRAMRGARAMETGGAGGDG